MKKILLALMMISSFSFASGYICGTSNLNGVLDGQNLIIGASTGSTLVDLYPNNPCFGDTNFIYMDTSQMSITLFTYYGENGSHKYYQLTDYGTTPANCPVNTVLTNGECEPIPQIPTCDYGQGQYLNSSTNTCTDCSSFPTIAGRASCACDSQGSTYNDQSVTGTYTDTIGFTNYDRTDAKCTNGGYVPVFLNPRPVDSNTTTPTNPTTPPDTNGSGTGTGDTGGGTGGTGGGTGTGGTGGTTTPDTNTTTPTTPTTPTGTTNYADLITQLKANNQSVNDFKDKFTQFVTSDQANADRQYNATNAIKSAVDGTTSAVNTQGTAITNKLGDILNAIKDGNGTGGTGDGNNTNQIDLNATNKKLDTLHDDNNKTQGILDKIKGMFDNNDSFKVPDTNGSTPKVEDLIKDENWFNTNKMKLDFSYSGDCYCQTAQFEVGGRTFIFPPQELLDMIPFDVISKMLMAFVYLIGLRQFLRN